MKFKVGDKVIFSETLIKLINNNPDKMDWTEKIKHLIGESLTIDYADHMRCHLKECPFGYSENWLEYYETFQLEEELFLI